MRERLFRGGSAPALALLGALAATSIGGPALAADPPAKTPSAAAPANSGLSEIVVTAQFRQTQLQKTPLAISAMTGQQLAARGETNVMDVAATVPNTVISPLGSGWGSTLAAFIRGVGLGDNILSFEPGVPIYVDDVYNGRPQGSIFDLLDLDRVEVLRGPQGALFGKNAIGGAVRLISKEPNGSDTGYLEAGYGSYNRVNIRGAWDGVIVPDKLFIRLAVSSKHADGYFNLLDYVCVHGAGSLGNIQPATTAPGCVDGHLGSEGVDAGRIALRYVANEKFEVNLIGDLTVQRQEAPADKYTYIANPMAFPGPYGIDGAVPQLWTSVPQQLYGAGVMYDQRFVTDNPYTSYARYGVNAVDGRDTPNENNLNHWGVSATTNWDIAPTLQLKTITAYRNWWNTFGRGDASPLGNSETFDDTTHHQFTEEWQLIGTLQRLDYTFGAFYYGAFDQNTGFDSLLPVPPGLPPLPAGSFTGLGIGDLGLYDHNLDDRQVTTDYAFYAHGVYHITDQLNLTAGVRYTDDSKHAVVSVMNRYTTVGDFSEPVNVGATRVNPMAELSYQATPDLMGYVLYSTGFRGGGFSPRPSDALQAVPFGPEDVVNYEVGFKSEWFQHKLRLNADIFQMYDNGQQNYKTDVDADGVTWFHELNAGNSINEGFEVEAATRPIEGLQIDSSLGYLHYHLKDDLQSRTTLICTRFSDGSLCPQTRAPKWTFSAGAQYRVGMGRFGALTPRMDVQVISRVYYTPIVATCSVAVAPGAACPEGDVVAPNKAELISTAASGVPGGLDYQPGYTLVNAHLTWDAPDGKWSTTLQISNLTNKVYFYGKLALAVDSLGREQGNIAPPRQWLVTVRRAF